MLVRSKLNEATLDKNVTGSRVISLIEIVQFWNEDMILDCVWSPYSSYQSMA